jgi:hypothetical protein
MKYPLLLRCIFLHVVGIFGAGTDEVMSPFNTLISCGSSSILVLRSNRPTPETRGSHLDVMPGPKVAALAIVVRNSSRHIAGLTQK